MALCWAFFCSAFVRHVFAEVGVDLVVWPGPLGLLAAQASSPAPSDGAAGAAWAWAATSK